MTIASKKYNWFERRTLKLLDINSNNINMSIYDWKYNAFSFNPFNSLIVCIGLLYLKRKWG